MLNRSSDHASGMVPTQGAPVAHGDRDNLLHHYATVLRRRYRWVIMGLVVGIVAGVVSMLLAPEPRPVGQYFKATHSLVASTSGAINGQASSSSGLLQQALLYAQSDAFFTAMQTKTGLSRQQLVDQVSANPSPNVNTPAVDVTAVATDPALATKLADLGADEVIALTSAANGSTNDTKRAQLTSQITSLEAQQKDLAARVDANPDDQASVTALSQVRDQLSSARSDLDAIPQDQLGQKLITLQPAMATQINGRGYAYRVKQNSNARNPLDTSPKSTNSAPDFDETDLSVAAPMSKTTRIALGGVAGLVTGLLAAFLIEAWDDRLRDRERVEAVTGLGVLSEVPHIAKDLAAKHHLAVVDEPGSAIAERYRAARAAVQFVLDAGGRDRAEAPVIIVTSPSPSEGKTTTTANLAVAFAESGMKTLVIDADFRRPSIRRFLSPTNTLVIPDEPTETRVGGLWFQPGPHTASSPDEAVALLREMVPAARGGFDLILLDTPPILTTNDASDLLEVADEVVLVLRSGQTKKRAARRVVDLLARFNVEPVGVVLNSCARRDMDPSYGYKYGYYLRGGSSSTEAAPSERPRTGDAAGHGSGASSRPEASEPAAFWTDQASTPRS